MTQLERLGRIVCAGSPDRPGVRRPEGGTAWFVGFVQALPGNRPADTEFLSNNGVCVMNFWIYINSQSGKECIAMAAATPTPPKKKFTFPTAFTILFILLILIALATWIDPAHSYQLDADGAPIPGTYQQVPSNPQKMLASASMGPINGMHGIEDAKLGNVNVWNSGELFGAIDVALFVLIIGGFLGVTMKTGAINAGDRLGGHKTQGQRRAAHFPGPYDDFCHRWHLLRHGRGDAGLLCPDHHGDACRRL